MMQRLTSKRLGHRAYFRSLLMLGLVAGGACAPLATVAAQSPSGLAGLPNLPGLPMSGVEVSSHPSAPALPPVPAMLPATLASSSSKARIAAPRYTQAAPKRVASGHLVQLLGLKPRGSAALVSRSTPLAMPSQFDTPVVPELKQVQFESSPRAAREGCVPASETSSTTGAGVVTHAYLAQPGAAPLHGVGQAPVRPLSSAPVAGNAPSLAGASADVSSAEHGSSDKHAARSGAATPDQESDAPVVRGPVKCDPAFAGSPVDGAPADRATAKPAADSESLLDLDLSALAIQGPTTGPVTGSGTGALAEAGRAQAKSVLVEDSAPKLIGTESGSLSQSQPIARAPQLSLTDAYLDEERDHRPPSDAVTHAPVPTPVKAQLAATTARPTRVKIHETFAPNPSSPAQTFHLSDTQVAASRAQAPDAPALATAPEQAEADQAESKHPEAKRPEAMQAETKQPQSLPTATVVSAPALLPPAPLNQAPTLAAAPTLATAPRLAGASMAAAPALPAAAARSETSSLLPVPFEPGRDGLVVKASRPGLELPEQSKPHESAEGSDNTDRHDASAAIAELAEPRTPEIANSSAQRPASMRPVSMRIGAEAMTASSNSRASSTASSTRDFEPRPLIDHNPLAHTGPVVRAVKQMIPEPETKPAAAIQPVAQATAVAPLSKQSKLAQELMAAIKKTFPSSRVELKPDEEEEGLVAEGVAASETEAKKILAMVRKTALCPVADRIITTR